MNKEMQHTLAHIVAILTVCVWGTTFVSTKTLLMSGLEPADIFFYRFVVAYICTFAICHKQIFAHSWRDELLMMLLGVFGGSLYFLTENMSLVYAQASDVSIIVSSCPLITSLLFALFFKSERLTARQNLGLVIAFIGIVFVVMNGQVILHISPLGYMLALGAALCWACYSLISRGVMSRYSVLFINRKVFFYGLLTILPYYMAVEPLKTDVALLSAPFVWLNLLFLGLIASMLCFISWMWVMKTIGAIQATVYIYLNPLFTIFFAVMLLNENVTWMAIVGTLVLIAGMYMAEKKKKV